MPLRWFEKFAKLWRAEWPSPETVNRVQTEERAMEALRERLELIGQELAHYDRRKRSRTGQ